MDEIVFDIETDGINPTVIHCWSASGGKHGTTKESFQREVLDTGATLVGHNILAYDCPALRRLWGLDFTGVNLVDSLVLSRLANPSRPGGHGLEAWGNTLGYPKVAHEDWTTYSPEMKHRCDVDVEINERVLKLVRKELSGFKDESLALEHSIAEIIASQVSNGCELDTMAALMLAAELRDEQARVEQECQETFRPLATPGPQVTPKLTKQGTLSKVGTKFLGDDWGSLGGPCTRVTFPPFNLGSNAQIAAHLGRLGWKPKTLTPTGAPVVDEGALKDVDIPEAQLILRYKNLSKVATMIESWLEAQDDDGRIRGYVNPNGAVTGRMTHSSPNLAQVPARGDLGSKCRELFIAKEGYSLVGMDASGLELRMLAHYMGDEAYTKAVVEGNSKDGTDAHSVNMRAAGLGDRATAKTFIYALLYGAGDGKIAEIAGLPRAKDGKALKERFLRATPALGSLKSRVEAAAARGYLIGLDGRRIAVRSQHAALNTLLQGAGAVVMKRSNCLLRDSLGAEGVWQQGVYQVLSVHDEIQAEVRDDLVPMYREHAEAAMVAAGEYYNLRCPLSGDSASGANWNETH
tara:strand:+ start:745 stop:2475 length:1731 start_codon:yes stop_codon:yes gene_type:complete